jgi:hypothetical protein
MASLIVIALVAFVLNFLCKKFAHQCPTRLCAIVPSWAALNIGTQIQWDCDDTPFRLICCFPNFQCGTKLLLWLPPFPSNVFSMSPFVFCGDAFFLSEVSSTCPFAFCGVPLFSSEVFSSSPFVFCGAASFFIRGLFNEPLCVLWGWLFFHRRSFLGAPLSFVSVPLFSSEGFSRSPFVFWGVPLFFHQSSFQWANEWGVW